VYFRTNNRVQTNPFGFLGFFYKCEVVQKLRSEFCVLGLLLVGALCRNSICIYINFYKYYNILIYKIIYIIYITIIIIFSLLSAVSSYCVGASVVRILKNP